MDGLSINLDNSFCLEDFEILHPAIGTGTFAKVFRCVHRTTKNIYCMKIMNLEKVLIKKMIERVLNEANIVKTLNHPHVVKAFSSFIDAGNLYILMEYVAGGDLFDILCSMDRLPPKTAKLCAMEIVHAMEYLHQRDIIFRDVKPENILVDAKGHLKLTDFGYAKQLQQGQRTFSICGTPGYIAPEILCGTGHNEMVDWWALGIFIFEMLDGNGPFGDECNFESFDRVTLRTL